MVRHCAKVRIKLGRGRFVGGGTRLSLLQHSCQRPEALVYVEGGISTVGTYSLGNLFVV